MDQGTPGAIIDQLVGAPIHDHGPNQGAGDEDGYMHGPHAPHSVEPERGDDSGGKGNPREGGHG